MGDIRDAPLSPRTNAMLSGCVSVTLSLQQACNRGIALSPTYLAGPMQALKPQSAANDE